MRPILLLSVTALLAAPVGADAQSLLGGGDLLDWMGLEPGDTMVFEDGEAQRCVTVEEPREIRGRRYAELRGLPWPGLASDSRVLVPLDGAVGLSLIATPGPRPNPRALLPEATAFLPGWPPEARADGWYALGPERNPSALAWISCSLCSDAGTRVVFDRGRGIRSITSTTIAGTTTLTRVDDASCAERPEKGVEFEVYVLPQDDDRP